MSKGRGGHEAKRPSKLIPVLLTLFFLFGVGVMAYPFACNVANEYANARAAAAYGNAIAETPNEETQAAWEAARAYNEAHTANAIVDPFDEEGEYPESEDGYWEVLDPTGNGVMGYIDIPKIGLRLAIYHGTSAKALEQGVGHLQGTSLPVGGAGTHCVLSGHRGLATAKLFTDLDQLEVGDQFYLHVLDQVLAYEVDQVLVVTPDQVDALAIVEGEDLVTLVTCTPYAVNTHRMLVRGHRVEYVPYEERTPVQAAAAFEPWQLAVAGGVIVLVLLAVYIAVTRRPSRR